MCTCLRVRQRAFHRRHTHAASALKVTGSAVSGLFGPLVLPSGVGYDGLATMFCCRGRDLVVDAVVTAAPIRGWPRGGGGNGGP